MAYPSSGPSRGTSPVDAVVYGWRKLLAQPGPWLGFMALAGVLTLAIRGFAGQLAAGHLPSPLQLLGLGGGYSLGHLVSTLIGTMVEVFVLALLCRAALWATGMTRITFADLLRIDRPGPVALVALGCGVVRALTGPLPVIGAIVGALLLLVITLVLLVLVDGGADAPSGVRRALRIAQGHTPMFVVLWLLVLLVNVAGFVCCFVGLLVTIPATVIAQAAALRGIQGRRMLL